jgi:hypothetical protein
MGLLELKPGNPDCLSRSRSYCSLKIRWESRSCHTAAISAKAADFAIFARPAVQPLLLRQRLR